MLMRSVSDQSVTWMLGVTGRVGMVYVLILIMVYFHCGMSCVHTAETAVLFSHTLCYGAYFTGAMFVSTMFIILLLSYIYPTLRFL